MTDQPVLTIDGLTCRYGELAALDHFSIEVGRDEIHALLGERGAGKTALLKILGGLTGPRRESGRVLVEGNPVEVRSPRDAIDAGIAVLPRRPGVFDRLTVAENLAFGQWQLQQGLFIDRRGDMSRARQILSDLGLNIDPAARASSLSDASRRFLAIARAVATRPRVLIHDEPANVLTTPGEMSQLIHLLRTIASHGIASLYMTTRISEVELVADRVSVLRDGIAGLSAKREEWDTTELARAIISQRTGALAPDEDETTQDTGMLGMLKSIFKVGR